MPTMIFRSGTTCFHVRIPVMGDDKRIIRRQRVLKSGKIALAGGASILDCVIRNLSVAGAQVELPSTVGVPDAFTLIDAQTGTSYEAKVAWRKGNRMGVSFADRPEEGED